KNALIKAYVSGSALSQLVQSAASSSSTFGASSAGALGKLDFLGLALSAENDGFRLVGVAKGGSAKAISSGSTYTSQLVSTIPSGALAVVSFRGSKNLT